MKFNGFWLFTWGVLTPRLNRLWRRWHTRRVKEAPFSPLSPENDLPTSIKDIALESRSDQGHFDELRGAIKPDSATSSKAGDQLTNAWEQFFQLFPGTGAKDLDQRTLSLARQIRDNGVSYNVYADEGGPQRPWPLGLFPLIIDPDSWQQVEAGVMQRMRLLERVMADVYGPQQLLAKGLLPPALVHGHPGYLRPMHGVAPVGGIHLHIAAFDLARGPDGNWWIVGQRFQAPSGLGYLLENRLAISSQFPEAFQEMQVQRLAGTYRALIENLKKKSPAGADSHLALLTPGPYNETYFEHAYLARYLGLTLVEGNDLIVRDEHLFLKTLKGLVPVHGLLKRVDDQYLDPLELRPDSTLGVPGLLQAIRAGNVLVANAPGSAFLESPAILGFLPALSRHLLGEELAGPIMRHGEDYSAQAYVPMSQMPTWQPGALAGGSDRQEGRIVPRSLMLRVFAVSDGPQSWRVLPGGMARVAGSAADIASMQRGGSSADVWALTRGKVDQTSLLQPQMTPATLALRKRLVTSRAAENLFWLGRYSERTENAIRLARLTLESLQGEHQSSTTLLAWLSKMALANTLVLPGVPSPEHARRVFERSLISSLGSTDEATSVGYYVRALKMAASSVRERLSQEHWRVIVRAEEELFARCAESTRRGDYSSMAALQILKDTSDHMAAITGAQTDRMTRDDGWRLLSIGRHIERLSFLASALASGLETGSVHTDGGFEAMIELFDCTITFHAEFQQSHDLVALVDLLVLDRDNPHSLAWIAHTMRGRLAKLAGCGPDELCALALMVPDPSAWSLEQLCEAQPDPGYFFTLNDLLLQCVSAALKASDKISTTYFTHSRESKQSVGT